MSPEDTREPDGLRRVLIVRVNSFEGRDTFLRCGSETQDHLFAVVAIDDHGQASVVDNGYRTHAEAAWAWRDRMSS